MGKASHIKNNADSAVQSKGELRKIPSRLVPLQQKTLFETYSVYEANRDKILYDYGVSSFSAFVNYIISTSLDSLKEELVEENLLFSDYK